MINVRSCMQMQMVVHPKYVHTLTKPLPEHFLRYDCLNLHGLRLPIRLPAADGPEVGEHAMCSEACASEAVGDRLRGQGNGMAPMSTQEKLPWPAIAAGNAEGGFSHPVLPAGAHVGTIGDLHCKRKREFSESQQPCWMEGQGDPVYALDPMDSDDSSGSHIAWTGMQESVKRPCAVRW
jgi:hypothetical protein